MLQCLITIVTISNSPGPMVYAAAVVPVTHEAELEALGCDDSKKLTHKERTRMMGLLKEASGEFFGWACRVLSPYDISGSMLRK